MAAIRSLGTSAEVYEYLVAHGTPPDSLYEAIRADTEALTGDSAGMQIGPDQYAFMRMLTEIAGVRRAVEVGTFTGTSAAAVAAGLQPGGKLICCDVSEEWTAIARKHWAGGGLDDRIELRIGPALDTIAALPDEPLDFAFVDADKPAYVDYFEALVPRLRSGGLLLADNTLWSGRVVDPSDTTPLTEAIRRFNDHVAADARVSTVILPLGDGVTICRKR